MGSRPRHPDKVLEQLIQDAEDRGWRVTRERKYYKALCPCPDKCKEQVHLTPQGDYAKNKRNKMSKCPWWDKGKP